MSSSRSIAAARNRRAGDSTFSAKQQPANKPITSINSQRAFTHIESNVTENTPKTAKLRITDAIGLITLRLGKIEQYIIDNQNSDNVNNPVNSNGNTNIDNSVFNTILNRLNALEKNDNSENF